MTGDRQPSRPIDAYKEIIDQLVSETSHSITAKQVAEGSHFLDTSDHAVFNPFLESLSIDQREVLARMIRGERVAAIHDVLAVLTWWVLARGVGFVFKSEPMPVELSGMGLHGDYIGRLDGWEWPKDDGVAGS